MRRPRRVQRGALKLAVHVGLLLVVTTTGTLLINGLLGLPVYVSIPANCLVLVVLQWRFYNWHDRQDAIEAAELEEQP